MRVKFAFGKSGLELDIPDTARVLDAKSAQALPDAVGALEQALEAPHGGVSLRALAEGKKTAAISVCDITRPAPNRVTLPPILRRLEEAGIARENTTICIATGLHRIATEGELREILGPEIAASYPIHNHDARIREAHLGLGTTQGGTPVAIATPFVEADLHISLGFIEPHLMAGFSGGRKLVAPGLAHEDTIKVLHSPRFMRDARASEGSTEENPLHRELLEIARMARHDFMLDVALTRERKIAGIFAGDPEQAHAAGVRFVSKALLEQVDQKADVVITTCAGYPLDLTFYQAIKGATAAAPLLKEGGRLVLLAECAEGAGAAEFRAMMLSAKSPQELLDRLSTSPVEVDQWMLEKLALIAARCDFYFHVPGLSVEQRQALWGRSFDKAEEALEAALARLPEGARVLAIPEGPYVLARAQAA